jgi:hypothetical protein
MIEPEAAIKVYNETLGAKGARGKLVRVSEHGYYEVLIESAGRFFTALLPVAGTVILAAEPEEAISTIEVER